ncbi:LysE family translocator [Endozoicomonas atrinae]|uniref:LysE family translocator n=1 Tax=Endozoicomonas atrinae TaxID=1333660 RepID=UPI003B00C843
MSLESGLAFFAAILIFSVTPGPGVFAVLARALISGARSCFYLSLGMAISDIIYLILACFGLAVIAQNWGEVFTVIRWVGAAYLFYIGYKIWKSPISESIDGSALPAQGKAASFLQGFLISASNPKVILFYIAFLPTFMDVTVFSVGDIAIASALTLIGLMIGLMCIAGTAAKARQYFKSPKAMGRLNKASGSIMMGAGSFLALKSQ